MVHGLNVLVVLVAALALTLGASSCVDRIPPPIGDDDFVSTDDDDSTPPVDDDDTTPPVDDDDTTPDDDDTTPDDDDTTVDDDDTSGDDDTSDDDDATIEPSPCPCGFGQMCAGEICIYADTFAVGALESSSSAIPYAASAAACFWTPAFLGGPIVAVDGDCTVSALDPTALPTQFFEGDAGTVTLTGGVLDPILFAAAGPAECLADNVTIGTDIFNPGATLHFEGTGGADFPSFEAYLSAPTPISGAPGIFTPGSNLTMAWTAGAGSYVELVISADDSTDGTAYAVTCRVPDTGGFTIPGSMTGWIPVPNDGVTAVFARNTVAHLEYPAEGVVIEAVLQTNWTTPLP